MRYPERLPRLGCPDYWARKSFLVSKWNAGFLSVTFRRRSRWPPMCAVASCPFASVDVGPFRDLQKFGLRKEAERLLAARSWRAMMWFRGYSSGAWGRPCRSLKNRMRF